jgi:N-terminal acetyltransferase B complex non-catalytic subunit
LTEKAAVALHLEELPSRKLIFKDLETIQVYEEAFGEVFPGLEESWARIIGEIRWQCVKSSPKDEEISLDCFKECLAQHDIDHARQVC